MDYILAVIDWVENTLIPSFFNPSNLPGRDDEFSPAPFKENHTLCVWFRKRFYHCHKNASLRTRINIGQPTKIINTRRCYLMSSDTNSLAHTKWNCKYHIVFAPKYRRQVIYGKIKRYWNDFASIVRKKRRRDN